MRLLSMKKFYHILLSAFLKRQYLPTKNCIFFTKSVTFMIFYFNNLFKNC